MDRGGLITAAVTCGCGLAAWWLWKLRYRAPTFATLSNKHAIYFQDLYDDARKMFREKATAAGAELHILPLEGECWGGGCGDPNAFEGEGRLTIDVAVVRATSGAKNGPMMLHLSGMHGVEGHSGSAIQIKFLDDLAQGAATVPPCPYTVITPICLVSTPYIGAAAVPPGVTLILIHVMNPYGFKHGRRYNENNVDLNRNFLAEGVEAGIDFDWAVRRHPAMEAYKRFEPLFNWTRTWRYPLDDLLFYLKAAYHLFRYRYTDLKRAAVSGQYFNKRGIWKLFSRCCCCCCCCCFNAALTLF